MDKSINIEDFVPPEIPLPKKPEKIIEKIGQDHLYNLLMGNELSWQAIIYDLINTEQLDPWDIDLALLAQKYLEKIREFEETNFFISSKVLLAASLLLRLKAEILLNRHLKSLDEILYGKKEEKKYAYERIILDENEIPDLLPKTPLPRFRKVTLQELMSALNKAIATENRRIKREIYDRQREKIAQIVLPKQKIHMRDRIKMVMGKVKGLFSESKKTRVSFTELAGTEKEARISTFLPLLHLDTQLKLGLEQEKHFEEIWIWLFNEYQKKKQLEKANLTQEERDEVWENAEQEAEEIDEKKMRKIEKINSAFENPMADFFEKIT